MRTKPAPRRVLALVLAVGCALEKIGAPLFVPDAGKDPAALGL